MPIGTLFSLYERENFPAVEEAKAKHCLMVCFKNIVSWSTGGIQYVNLRVFHSVSNHKLLSLVERCKRKIISGKVY